MFKCVPSQINYVLDTRFTTERGYYVESRRGGGGCIIIKRVRITKSDYLMHIINDIGNHLSQQDMHLFINNFIDYGIITQKEAMIMKAAASDKVLPPDPNIRDMCRANILKNNSYYTGLRNSKLIRVS
jgi:transcriptional regulator CtsR